MNEPPYGDIGRPECVEDVKGSLRQLRGISPECLDIQNWPRFDEAILPDDKRRTYLMRKKAVELFLKGQSAQTIKACTGITIDYIRRLIRTRCVVTHPDGRLFGWRGLIPSARVNDYRRQRKVRVDKWGKGASGALGLTFSACSATMLQQRFDRKILRAASDAGANKNTHRLKLVRFEKVRLFRWFLEELRKQELEVKGEWPFNTERMGYVTICKYIDRVLDAHPRAKVSSQGGADAVVKMRSGDGVNRPVFSPYFRVECDAHKKDGRFIVLVPSPDGGYVERLVHRLWVIVILEVVSRAVLGYFLSMRREVNSDDVLATIKRALTKWRKRTISFSENAYHPEAGFPSSIDERLVGACWDEFSVDGALAETCKRVEQKLNDVVGAKVVSPYNDFSVRRSKDDRPFVESFFRTLEQKGLQNLSISTGGNPSEKHGRDPAKIAITSRFQIEYAEELLDVEIANYNATPHSSHPNRSPLQVLQFHMSSRGLAPRVVDPHEVEMLFSKRVLCKIHGGAESGRRPYVNYEYGRYSSDLLGRRYDLVGKHLWIVQPTEDARFVRATTESGIDLGTLQASPPWHRTPHNVFVRKTCHALARKRLIYLASHTDPVEQLAEYAESQIDKKLPPHPGYLESRRILREFAETLTGQSMVDAARERLSREKTSTEHPNLNQSATMTRSSSEAAGGGDVRTTSLPPRRKVVQKY